MIVEFLFDRGLFFVSVHNIGDRPAVATSVVFNEKLFGLNGTRDISSQALFRNIEFLGPGREIVTFLDRSSSYFSGRRPTKLVATVSYSDPEGQRYEATIKHDLEIYRELAFLEMSELGAEGPDSAS